MVYSIMRVRYIVVLALILGLLLTLIPSFITTCLGGRDRILTSHSHHILTKIYVNITQDLEEELFRLVPSKISDMSSRGYTIVIAFTKPSLVLDLESLMDSLDYVVGPEGEIYYKGLEDYIMIKIVILRVNSLDIPVLVIYVPTFKYYIRKYNAQAHVIMSISVKDGNVNSIINSLKGIVQSLTISKEADTFKVHATIGNQTYKGSLNIYYNVKDNRGECTIDFLSVDLPLPKAKVYNSLFKNITYDIIRRFSSKGVTCTITKQVYNIRVKDLVLYEPIASVNIKTIDWRKITFMEVKRLIERKILLNLSLQDANEISSKASLHSIIMYYKGMWASYIHLCGLVETWGKIEGTRLVKSITPTTTRSNITRTYTKAVTATTAVPTVKGVIREAVVQTSTISEMVREEIVSPKKKVIAVTTQTVHTTIESFRVHMEKILIILTVTIITGIIAYITIRKVLPS